MSHQSDADIKRSVEVAYAAMVRAGVLARPRLREGAPAHGVADRLKSRWRRSGLRRAIRLPFRLLSQGLRALAQALGVRS